MKIAGFVLAVIIGIMGGYAWAYHVYNKPIPDVAVEEISLPDEIVHNPQAVIDVWTKDGCKTYPVADVQYQIKSADSTPEGLTMTFYPKMDNVLAIVWFMPKEE